MKHNGVRAGRLPAPTLPKGRGIAADVPRVVALVPTWRAAEYIRETLDTLLAQTWPNLRILISDDASPDGTAAICEEYARRDPRVEVIRQPRNLGYCGNLTALLRQARGDYFLFAFQDDPLDPTYVEKCVAALEAHPKAVIAYSDILLVWQDGRRDVISYPLLDGVEDRVGRATSVASKEGAWWVPNRGVFRASAAAAIGGVRRSLAGDFVADWPWLLHMSLLGEQVRVPERLVTKVFVPRSLSRTWQRRLWQRTAVTLSAAATIWRATIPVSEKLALQWTLARSLASAYARSARVHVRKLRRAVRAAFRRPTQAAPRSPTAGA